MSNRPARGTLIACSGSGDCGGQVQGEACEGLTVRFRMQPGGVVVGAPGRHQLVRLRLPLQLRAAATGTEAVDEHPQRPGRGDLRILLPQRAGRGVARVRERRLAGFDQRGVEVGERSIGKNTSPRTSSTSGQPLPSSFSGITPMVRALAVTFSPVTPSPRVAAQRSTPS